MIKIPQDIITLLAALIGYLGAFVPSVIGRRTKQIEALKTIADGRMEWIREVRALYSDMITVLDLFPDDEESLIPVSYRELFYKARNGLMIRFTHSDEQDRYPSDKRIIEYLDGGMVHIKENRDKILNELQKVIQTEWKKVIETTGKAKDQEITELQTYHAKMIHDGENEV